MDVEVVAGAVPVVDIGVIEGAAVDVNAGVLSFAGTGEDMTAGPGIGAGAGAETRKALLAGVGNVVGVGADDGVEVGERLGIGRVLTGG